MPFCSLRCKQIDLGRWLAEEHSVPLDPEDEEAEIDRYESGSGNDNSNGRHTEDD